MARAPGTKDYRDLRPVKDGKVIDDRRQPQNHAQYDWWNLTGKECAGAVRSAVEFLQKNQQPRMRQQVVSARLYGNIPMGTSAGASYYRAAQSQPAVRDRITYNAVQSIIDTVTARIGENKPRPFYLTSNGDYRQQRRAKRLNQFVEGVFYENKTYDIGLKAFRDAAIWGDGFIHVFGRGGRVVHERVMPSEVRVDEIEGQYGFPRRMHRLKVVDREELCTYFPEARAEIDRAQKALDVTNSSIANLADMVTVVESWSLASPDADGKLVGGKHAITLVSGNHMLLEPEEYPYDFFPFARIPWCERPVGYWSQGLAEQLQGEQLELNKELWLIQRSMHLAGSFKVLVQNGSKIVKEALNNDVGAVITYTGTEPRYITPAPINEAYFQNTERIIQRMYMKAGVSELAAKSSKPAGLNSGKAIREFEDVESERFRTIQRQNDNLYLDIADLTKTVAKEMAREGRVLPVRVPDKRSFATIEFKRDIGIFDDSDFVRQCFPVSRLPRDPAGRLQTIQEYIQAGFMTPRQGRRALDFPDLDAVESLANAQEDIVTKVLDAMVDDGEYSPPEPTDDLAMAKETCLEYIQRYRALDLEPERMDLLRRYNEQVTELMNMATAAMAPPPMMGAPGAPGAPQAAPMPPPRSDLIPNVPQ